MTVNPYLGGEALKPFLERKDKCSIILAKTSNSGASEFQDCVLENKEILWQYVAKKVKNEWNTNNNLMIVIGGTNPDDVATAREITGDMTFLVPGIGAQGGEAKNIIEKGINKEKLGLIINSSRGIIFSENPKEEAKKLRDEINRYR